MDIECSYVPTSPNYEDGEWPEGVKIINNGNYQLIETETAGTHPYNSPISSEVSEDDFTGPLYPASDSTETTEEYEMPNERVFNTPIRMEPVTQDPPPAPKKTKPPTVWYKRGWMCKHKYPPQKPIKDLIRLACGSPPREDRNRRIIIDLTDE